MINLKKFRKAVPVYDEVLHRHQDYEDTPIENRIVQTLYYKAFSLEKIVRFWPALKNYNKIIYKYHHSKRPEMVELVDKSLNRVVIICGMIPFLVLAVLLMLTVQIARSTATLVVILLILSVRSGKAGIVFRPVLLWAASKAFLREE